MKVLKFGGTSVGSVESILSLKKIVETAGGTVVVVVSALGGITDKLINTAQLATSGDTRYKDEFDAMVRRHHDMINTIITDGEKRVKLLFKVDKLFGELESIYYGLYLVHELGAKSQATIVSYGERLSSIIVAALIDGAAWADSREFIKTESKRGKNRLNAPLTDRLIKEKLAHLPAITIVPGFISTDTRTGEVTNLGRGGSDYTAAIIASALDAGSLEIWTDVNGFMTADPRIIPGARTIPQLSYGEAIDLCNFGAKVIYPPTLYPVCDKKIPILVKNTFAPGQAGTIIQETVTDDGSPIKGISNSKGLVLLTVSSPSQVVNTDTCRRIFTALADSKIPIISISQISAESSILIGVSEKDKDDATEALDEEFGKEIADGIMPPVQTLDNLASIAIIGENIKNENGLPGTLFNALGKNGIRVMTMGQGPTRTSISVTVESERLNDALKVVHEALLQS